MLCELSDRVNSNAVPRMPRKHPVSLLPRPGEARDRIRGLASEVAYQRNRHADSLARFASEKARMYSLVYDLFSCYSEAKGSQG